MKTKPYRHSIFAFAFPTPLPAPCPSLTFPFSVFCFLLSLSSAFAATRYVWQDSPGPAPPYANWTTAAHVIQDAVDAAQTGDTVLVAGGAYATGGRAVGTNLLANRVAIDRAITVESLMGPEVTIIQGYQVPGTTNGDGAIRCVYLKNGASLSGFTLTNGATRNAGDWDRDRSGGGVWCESTNAFVTKCVFVSNWAQADAAGAYGGTLNGCTLRDNSAGDAGGGAYYATLNNCTLTGNSAAYGGGASYATLNNCTLSGNSAAYGGGGVDFATLNNCTLTGNSADTGGGAGGGSTLNNCTLTGNSAYDSGGGAYDAWLNNCIVYFNTASTGVNYYQSLYSTTVLNYCCTAPMPTKGLGNMTLDPQLASASHLSVFSPCRGAGSSAYASGTDMDGEAWATPPSIGCDEYHAGTVTGPLSVGIAVTLTNVMVGYPVGLTARIEGRTTLSIWDFGDGVVVSNRPYASHAWATPGDYAVPLQAFNESNPAGVSATVTIHVLQGVHYVAPGSANPVFPYTTWATAARNIQDAVDAAVIGGTVLVTNGIYATGGRDGNRVAVYKPLTVRSVNGPHFTVVDGSRTVRCAYLTNGTSLVGLTLTNGNGGGVSCASSSATVSNCVLAGNSGGGASGGTLNNCIITGNSAYDMGAGVYGGTLYNCTLTGNSVNGPNASGGGAFGATLNNCIVYFNTAAVGANYDSTCTLNYCCTTPLPEAGTGNITGDPELASASHLSVFSPCRGAGSPAYTSGVDIDGEAWANPPSIGCDEYQAGAVAGPLCVDIAVTLTNVAVGYPVSLTALIEGRTTLSIWEFGDGTLSLDQPYETHTWMTPGDYEVSLWALNDSHPDGMSATLTIYVEQGLHYVAADSANPVPPYTSWTTAATNIQDAVDVAIVGGTILVTNGNYTTGGRVVYGTATNRVAVTKPVTVRSVNGPQFTVIQGWQVPGTTNGDGAIRCVYLTNGASLSGFTLTYGATRTNPADFRRERSGGGAWCASTNAILTNCVLVGNSADAAGGGAYSGTLNNCTFIGNSATYSGGGACASTLNNCTLTGNSADTGGGASYATLNNCTLTDNWAYDSGGGASGGILNNCTLTGNTARRGGGACCMFSIGAPDPVRLNNCVLSANTASEGGGVYVGTLNNCTLIGNSADHDGGGVGGFPVGGGCTLNNCIVYFNTAAWGEANYDYSFLSYCCTIPDPGGVGNITNAPLFADYAGGNLRLQSTSPCINAGNNDYVSGTTDLDSLPRIVGGTVDIGAYECQSPALLDYYAWLQGYGLPTDASATYADSDDDGLNNWQEWRCGTCPTNRLSALRLLAAASSGSNITVTWQSVAGVNYFLERSTNLASSPLFTPLGANIPGQPGTTTYTDTNAAGASPHFYRAGVGN
jgi:hypothetical protein